jgi:hypothetical protein
MKLAEYNNCKDGMISLLTCHRLTQTFKKVFYPGAPEFIPGLNIGVRVFQWPLVTQLSVYFE